jgi:protein-S-isoprenylcysteine O-methyltransferase Ste14
MEPALRTDRRRHGPGSRTASILAAAILALVLLFAAPTRASTDNAGEATFEDRAAAEKMSRSRYRKLEVASLVIIFAAGAGAAYWAMRRRKP